MRFPVIHPSVCYSSCRWPTVIAAGTRPTSNRIKMIMLQQQKSKDLIKFYEPLRQELSRAAGGSLKDNSRNDVMASIRKLAVLEVNSEDFCLFELRLNVPGNIHCHARTLLPFNGTFTQTILS